MRINSRILAACSVIAVLLILGSIATPVEAGSAGDYFVKAQTAQRQGRISEAIRLYHRALYMDGNMTAAGFALVDLYYVQGQIGRAMDVLDGLPEDASTAGQRLARKGLLLRASGDIAAAERAYRAAVAAAPADPDVLGRAAGFFRAVGNRTEAEALSQIQRSLLEH